MAAHDGNGHRNGNGIFNWWRNERARRLADLEDFLKQNQEGVGFVSFRTAQNVPKDASWQSASAVMQDYYPAITVQCATEHYETNGWGGCVAPRVDGTPTVDLADETFGAGTPGVAGR